MVEGRADAMLERRDLRQQGIDQGQTRWLFDQVEVVRNRVRFACHCPNTQKIERKLSGAPYGDHYLSRWEGGGEARDEIIPEQAQVVQQIFTSGRARLNPQPNTTLAR
ncbi:hypothetical protein [Thiocystis minor]|uniref:hypothetical protein n=1 Tax=Thiocystis minor TaxID=61597 RepID=UPI001912D9D6|nr:hypothetical protein [Thiocystis minor]